MIKQKSIAIIAGSWFGSGKVLHLVKAAKQLGLRSVVITAEEKYLYDWNVQPDLKIISIATDPFKFEWIRNQLIDEEIIYVAHGDDRSIQLVCFLNKSFNIVGPSESSYESIYNKKYCCAILESLKIPHAKAIYDLDSYHGPLFVKPTRSSGTYSKDDYSYRKWTTKEELFSHLAKTGKTAEFESLFYGRASNSIGELIVQEFIDNQITYFADIFVSKSGQAKTIITNSIHWTIDGVEKTRQINRKTQYLNLELESMLLSVIEAYASKISDFLDYKNSWMSIEFWIIAGKPVLVEINPRASGSTNEALDLDQSCLMLDSILAGSFQDLKYASKSSIVTINHWLPNIGKGIILESSIPEDSADCRLVQKDKLKVGSFIDSTGRKLIDWAPAIRAKATSIEEGEKKVQSFLSNIDIQLINQDA